MEFREFTNSEESDYDVKSSLKREENFIQQGKGNLDIQMELLDLLGGFIEDVTDEQIFEMYGITFNEYMHPTRETINKVKNKLNNNVKTGRSR